MTFPNAIRLRNPLARAILLHSVLLLGLAWPPRLKGSEHGDKEIGQPLPATLPATADASGLVAEPAPPPPPVTVTATSTNLLAQLKVACALRLNQQAAQAEPALVSLLADENPDTIRQPALLELALCAQDQNNLPRAQQIYAQFLSRWPNAVRTPQILLRQGQLFREMGLNSLALTKFYSVMTAALALKTDELEAYKRLVMQAQNEIAETHFQMGKFADAADYFSRLIKQNNPLLDRAKVQYRLLRSLAELDRHDEAIATAQDYLIHFPAAPERPEVRFLIAHALKELGRNNEALQQVLLLLQEQKRETADRPEVWAYWQQRAGNEVANQLFREGDYPKALDVYLSLARLDSTPAWQVPVQYQVGMTYEKLSQPQLAVQVYSNIVSREFTAGTNAAPGLKSVFEMARWRITFLDWQARAENSAKEFVSPADATVTATEPKS